MRFLFALVRKEGMLERGKKTFTAISTSVGSPLKVKTNQNVQMRLADLCVNCYSLRKLSLHLYLFTGLKVVRVVGLPQDFRGYSEIPHSWMKKDLTPPPSLNTSGLPNRSPSASWDCSFCHTEPHLKILKKKGHSTF